jgi:hypothetical protein
MTEIEERQAKCLSEVLRHNSDLTRELKNCISLLERDPGTVAPHEIHEQIDKARVAIGADPTGRGFMI